MSQTSNHLESLTWLTLLDMHHIIIRYAQQEHLVLPRLNPFTNTRTYAPNFCLLNMGHSLQNEMKIDWCCHKTCVIYLFTYFFEAIFSSLFLLCHSSSYATLCLPLLQVTFNEFAVLSDDSGELRFLYSLDVLRQQHEKRHRFLVTQPF